MTQEPSPTPPQNAAAAPAEPITLGLLQTGDVHRDLEAEHGAYPDMFMRLLQPAAPELRFETYRVVDGALPARVEACDAYLVTGSKFGVYDPEPWIAPLAAFLREAHGAGVPIIGVCFGHQILADALGGDVRKSEKGWGLGAHAYEETEAGAAAGLGLGETFALHAVHQDQVITPPQGATVLARSAFCPNAALAFGDPARPSAISIQPHPEFEAPYERALVALRRGDGIPEPVADAALAGIGAPVDNTRIADWFGAFLRQAWARRRSAA